MKHLNSDQKQYFWLSFFAACAFAYCLFRFPHMRGASLVFTLLESLSALAIYRNWKSAPKIYLVACLAITAWGLYRISVTGFNLRTVGITIGGLLSATGYYWLKKAQTPPLP